MVIVAIVGPTATGKSGLGLALARRGRPTGQIVNADAFSLYRGMDIGTAKPLTEERGDVAHHQIDVLEVDEDASVAQFQESARADIAAIRSAGERPIIVGGSGLYVRALIDQIEFPGTDPAIRERLEARADANGPRALHDELVRLDPEAARSIAPSNTKRIVRALEVIELTGDRFSANLPLWHYVAPTLQIGLDCDREVLDRRIEQRVERMWRDGLVEEVRMLARRGMGRTAARAVGYAEVLAFLRGDLTEEQAREAVATHTRRLTRKQMGWFGRDPRIHWLDASDPALVDQALELVVAADAGQLPEASGPDVRRALGGFGPAGRS